MVRSSPSVRARRVARALATAMARSFVRVLERPRGKPQEEAMRKLQDAIAVNIGLAIGALSAPRLRREEGQTFVEYALILALISVALAASLTVLKGKIDSIFTKIGNDLS